MTHLIASLLALALPLGDPSAAPPQPEDPSALGHFLTADELIGQFGQPQDAQAFAQSMQAAHDLWNQASSRYQLAIRDAAKVKQLRIADAGALPPEDGAPVARVAFFDAQGNDSIALFRADIPNLELFDVEFLALHDLARSIVLDQFDQHPDEGDPPPQESVTPGEEPTGDPCVCTVMDEFFLEGDDPPPPFPAWPHIPPYDIPPIEPCDEGGYSFSLMPGQCISALCHDSDDMPCEGYVSAWCEGGDGELEGFAMGGSVISETEIAGTWDTNIWWWVQIECGGYFWIIWEDQASAKIHCQQCPADGL